MALAEIILKFLLVVFELAKDAWEKKDPSKLRKVGDVFRLGEPLEVELSLAEARQRAIDGHKP